MSLIVCFIPYYLSAQSQKEITHFQYWIDNGERTEVAYSGSDTTLVIDASITNEGLHTINYRVKDSEGMYSPLHTWIYLRKGIEADEIVNSISYVEYWIDENTEHKQIKASENDIVTFSVDASALNRGLHKLTYFVSDIYGKCSPSQVWFFIKLEEQETTPRRIAWLRYWWGDFTDKAVKEEISDENADHIFLKEINVPDYARTDTTNFTARLHYVVGDNKGYISPVEFADVEYSDGKAPVSMIEVESELAEESVVLQWHTISDVALDYNIYYSTDDQPFVLWLPNTTKEKATFKGGTGHTYRFTVTARDKFNNHETLDESKCVKVTFTTKKDAGL